MSDPQSFHDFGALGQGIHAHGTRANYATGCRCLPCRSAEACYHALWARKQATGHTGWVDAAQARQHLVRLAEQGIGQRHAARQAGVAFATIQRIRRGAPRIQHAVNAKVLQVKPIPALGTTINSYRSRHLIRCLLAEGYETATIAAALGLRKTALAFDHARIRVKTAMKVRALWRRWTMD